MTGSETVGRASLARNENGSSARDYERAHKNRMSVLEATERKLANA